MPMNLGRKIDKSELDSLPQLMDVILLVHFVSPNSAVSALASIHSSGIS